MQEVEVETSTSFQTDGAREENEKERRSTVRRYAASSNRIVSKSGRENVSLNEVPDREYRYAKDIGNTLFGARWRWILTFVFLVNGLFYFVFAIAWWLIARFNDDIENDGSKSPPCIMGTKTFTGYLLLSIETLTTTGYGLIYPTECQPCWMVLTLQTLTTFVIEGILVSAVFVKMTRPYSKDQMSLFTRKAVVHSMISMRDGVFCLIFRVRDVYGKHWTKTTLKAVLIQRRMSPEGEPLPYYFENLKLEKQGLLFWPQEIVHKITCDSPLWTMSPSNIYKTRLEIMVVLEGDSTTTGQPSQSQTSYTNKEIAWGFRFSACVKYDKGLRKYVIDHEKFNAIEECDAPLCSALEFNEMLRRCDWNWSPSLSTPISRASDTSFRTLLKFSNYRMRKSDLGNPHGNEGGLETIDSVENLAESSADESKNPRKDAGYASTSL